jgi:hypothetical protein
VNASQRLDMTGAHLLRLQQALCRLPGVPVGMDRFAELSADPAGRLSDLIERVLRGGPASPADDRPADDWPADDWPADDWPADDWPEAAPGRQPVAVPGSGTAMATRRENRQAVRPGRRAPASGSDIPGELRATPDPPLNGPSAGPGQPAFPAAERPGGSTTPAAGRTVNFPPGTGPAGYGSRDAGGPAGDGPPADPGTGPDMTRADRSARSPGGLPPGLLPAAGPRPPPAASAHRITAPGRSPAADSAGAAPAPPAGARLAAGVPDLAAVPLASARLAAGFPDLAAVLQASVAGPAVPAAEMAAPLPEPGPPVADGPQPAGGAATPGPPRPPGAGEAGPRDPHEISTYDLNDPDLVAATDLRLLMERIACELELELIRVYGTSGR